MGQTLSHGVYLPNEGERNCYAGLASNWQILNTAVGNIAEKAPLVHTHGNITNDGKVGTTANLPLITGTGGAVQAGSFGNQANTFCEGNDSRLSDARTPLSHTHTKSDVTDLLNSNFIPSANNSYDLGSSSYQWKSIYANAYYLGTTAFGDIVTHNASEFLTSHQSLSNYVTLNSAQTISGIKTITGGNQGKMVFKNPNYTKGDVNESSVTISRIYFGNSASYDGANAILSTDINTSGNSIVELAAIDNTASSSTRTSLILTYDKSATRKRLLKSWGDFIPYGDSTYDLGSSSYQWNNVYSKRVNTQTLNGINPGALSLPDMDSTVSKSTELATAIDKTQTANSWTADFTGILRITWFVKNLTGPFRCTVSNNSDIRYATWGQTFSVNDAWYFIVSFPVQNGKTYYFDNSFTRTSEDTAPIIYGASAVYCLGNV